MSKLDKLFDILEVTGDSPNPRFGHTITSVNKNEIVLFGGATGDIGKYIMTNDTYLFNVYNSHWSKFEPVGVTPTPRAAHASVLIEAMQMIVYGGATGGNFFVNYSRRESCFRRSLPFRLETRCKSSSVGNHFGSWTYSWSSLRTYDLVLYTTFVYFWW